MIATRGLLDRELSQLNDDLVQLASLVDGAIDQAMTALYARDVPLAQAVVSGDEQINILRYRIENECVRILATQQPAARDLRTVLAGIQIAIELERMGDHAAGIARLVRRLENEAEFDTLSKLPKMAKRARQMLQEGIQAYLDRNVELAQAMIDEDNKLDKQYRKLFLETIEEMRVDEYIRRATYLLWVGHNLERIGDRATNIAERVIFMITGHFVEKSFVFE